MTGCAVRFAPSASRFAKTTMLNKHSYRIAPPELRCVWMTAGVVTYQLCDRNFECAGCPLDAAMRNAYEKIARPPQRPAENARRPLRPGRFYTAEHCWVDILSTTSVRIGVEPSFAKRLGQAEGISLPAAGRAIMERETAAWFRFEEGMVPVRLPFDVRVTMSNRAVRAAPALVAEDPYERGWLLEAEVEPDALGGRSVMTARAAERVYDEDEESFRSAVIVPGRDVHVGPTLQDGGEVNSSIIADMGTARYCALVARIYCKIN